METSTQFHTIMFCSDIRLESLNSNCISVPQNHFSLMTRPILRKEFLPGHQNLKRSQLNAMSTLILLMKTEI